MHNNSELCPVVNADDLGVQHFSTSSSKEDLGQFFTPITVAEFMASLLETPSKETIEILDPGTGTGILVAAAVKELASRKDTPVKNIKAILYEIDTSLKPTLNESMKALCLWCANKNVKFEYEVKWQDFVLAKGSLLQGQTTFEESLKLFDIVISNPPYFKISKDDPRAKACSSIIHGQPNIYALFMAVSASLLNKDGQFLFITPRSFASGQYFKVFRKYILEKIKFERVHQFSSRTDAFARDQVLQENVIFYGKAGASQPTDNIVISTSFGKKDLEESTQFKTKLSNILINKSELMITLPSDRKDLELLDLFEKWTNSIEKMKLKISTGPVVPFRATDFLRTEEKKRSVPLFWIQHVANLQITFPLQPFRKQQWFLNNVDSEKLLVKNQNMILMRRFSPKEDFRRLTVAPFLKKQFSHAMLGLENHLNYIYRPNGLFDETELLGLTGFLSSKLFDSYFRITNGNTQVSATEIKNTKLPGNDKILEIGLLLKELPQLDYKSIDTVVEEVLGA